MSEPELKSNTYSGQDHASSANHSQAACCQQLTAGIEEGPTICTGRKPVTEIVATIPGRSPSRCDGHRSQKSATGVVGHQAGAGRLS